MNNPSPAAIEAARKLGNHPEALILAIAEVIQQAIDKAREWQPIETAPQEDIWGCVKGTVVEIWWAKDAWRTYESWLLPFNPDRLPRIIEVSPTHWMPKRFPPQTENGGE